MVYLNYGILPGGTYLNLHSINELHREIEVSDTQVKLSPLTTYMDVRLHPCCSKHLPMLVKAATVVGEVPVSRVVNLDMLEKRIIRSGLQVQPFPVAASGQRLGTIDVGVPTV